MFIIRAWRSKFNIARRAYRFIFRILVQRLKLFDVATEVQNKRMHDIGLSRKDGLDKLNNILQDVMGKKYDERDGMFSEHLILLASISAAGIDIKRILEIGTFDGRTALILSHLFPESEIVTIDLPSDSDDFKRSYKRQGSVVKFKTKRDNYLKEAGNVEFREVNSLTMCDWKETFNLIWIDGAHGYPIVAMDVINSFRMAKKNAHILIDDIWMAAKESDQMYKSIGGFESLNALVDAKLITGFYLFPKRLSGVFNYPSEKKYVGLVIKR